MIRSRCQRLIQCVQQRALTATSAMCALILAGGIAAPHAYGSDDLTDLSLEALGEISLSSTIALGIHHTHPQGEWMHGYSFMSMQMDGNRSGTTDLGTAAVFDRGFMVAPTSMDMDMHMFETMYGVTGDVTLMVMAPYKKLSMDHLTAGGSRFTTETKGFGDTSITALYTFFRSYPHRMHLTAGVSLPTGSIQERGATPMGPNQKLPYPMQLGSGTYDTILGMTYLGTGGVWSWGVSGNAKIRSGTNSEAYALGNEFQFDTWLARKWNDRLSSYLRVESKVAGNIDGADAELNPMMVPTANPNLRGGERINLRVGTSVYTPSGVLMGSRLGVELGVPVYQSLNGPQLQEDWTLNFVVQWVR